MTISLPENTMRRYKITNKSFFSYTIFLLSLSSLAIATPRTQYLDEIAADLVVTQGWGNPGIKTAAHATGQQPMKLRIADKEYERGIGHHAPGEITVNLEAKYLTFEAEAGVQWQGGGQGSVVFEVWVDGEKRFESSIMNDSAPAQPISLNLVAARELRLVAKDGGDGFSCDMANWAEARLTYDSCLPDVGKPTFYLDGIPLEEPVEMEGSYAHFGNDEHSQFFFNRPLGYCLACVPAGETATISFPLQNIACPIKIHLTWQPVLVTFGKISLSLDSGSAISSAIFGEEYELTLEVDDTTDSDTLRLSVIAEKEIDTQVTITGLRLSAAENTVALNYLPVQNNAPPLKNVKSISYEANINWINTALVEWDWRMQDGIGSGQTQNTYKSAIEKLLDRGDAIAISAQKKDNPDSEKLIAAWQPWRGHYEALLASNTSEDSFEWENLWKWTHSTLRSIFLFHHRIQQEPILIVKQAPGVFSHQLTQYYGRYARPGGGLFVLDKPGISMQARQLGKDLLPPGSYMQPEVTHDGQRILFSFCETDRVPEDMFNGDWSRHYHIYEMDREGTYVKQLTDGDYDDFAPKELPNGQIMFVSTRRGGFHRCGGLGCPLYTLALMDADGSNIRTVSYHETQEWDPAVLNDGRVIYTRWDYVDRNAVHYQQLWTVHPDGTGPVAFYGNHTLNPVGVWEARAIPGSHKVMATAAAHHAMTAGSIILIDPTVGIDGFAPIVRLTPDAHFPESEDVLLPHWRSGVPSDPPERTPEMDRWPGQCYRSPWPLSEDLFLAAYSYDPLMGEPNANLANMFGLYLVDAYGNKELIYRDLNISSLWPMPLREREVKPVLPSTLDKDAANEGTYYLQDVYQSSEILPENTKITHLRILQVLPKSTPIANQPTVGLANASPGKQVLGTVPVEPDGSAYFRAPAGIPVCFQALDETGQAVHIMRSATYLQPGENASCIGCHEPRLGTPPPLPTKQAALRRTPSEIKPGPDGSKPFSYPILVQPVLDKHCIRCHSGEAPKGPEGKDPIRLTGTPQGRYTESYNTLAPRISFSAWGRGEFPHGNSEPTTQPGFFGQREVVWHKCFLMAIKT
jgi:hypothetical protein